MANTLLSKSVGEIRRTVLRTGAIALAGALAVTCIVAPAPARTAGPLPTQGVSATEIVLGSHQDLSGPVRAIGEPLKYGMELAVDEINTAGGIHGRTIRLIVEDSGFDPKKAVLATQKLLEKDEIFAMIGALGTAPNQASMPLVLEKGVLALFTGTPADFTYAPFHKLKFGLAVPYGEQMRAATRYSVEKLAKKKFGVLYQDDETGQNVLRAVEEQLKVHGMTVAEKTSYKRGASDFATQIALLKAANVDIVMLGTIIRETAGAMIEAQKQGWPVDMFVSQAGLNNRVVELGGAATEGLYAMAQLLPLASQPATPELTALIERYKKKFGRDPDDGMIFGYVAMQLFAEGARRAGRDLTTDSFVAALEQVRDFKTAFAGVPIGYGPGERLAARTAIVTRVKGAKFEKLTEPISY